MAEARSPQVPLAGLESFKTLIGIISQLPMMVGQVQIVLDFTEMVFFMIMFHIKPI